MVTLKKLSENDGRDIYDMLQGIDSVDNGFHNTVKDMPYEDFPRWLKTNVDAANGVGLEDWMVPQTTYWLYDGDIPVGCGRIRHYINDSLKENGGGHIGYAIAQPNRGKGYGNEILRLLLLECGIMGMKEAHVGANKDNVRSNKVICRNGGIRQEEINGKNYYIIPLLGEV